MKEREKRWTLHSQYHPNRSEIQCRAGGNYRRNLFVLLLVSQLVPISFHGARGTLNDQDHDVSDGDDDDDAMLLITTTTKTTRRWGNGVALELVQRNGI